MKRLIEINDEATNKKLTSEDLPLTINFIYDPENSNKIHIEKKLINNEINQSLACAYIAQEDGHLFFQADNELINKENIIVLHNNEIIEKSVWLKSGDVIKIADKLIHYQVMGDVIKIKVTDEKNVLQSPQIPLSPPPSILNKHDKINHLPRVDIPSFETSPSKKSKIIKTGFISLSLILVLMAFFMLQAEIVSIEIEPVADNLNMDGFFPVLPIAQRYIMMGGEYQILANKKNYRNLEKKIIINKDKKIFKFKMIELPGIVDINIESDSSDTILIDDVVMLENNEIENSRNARRYEIEKGIHQLKIINPRYKIYEQKINVAGKNKLENISVKLIPNFAMLKLMTQTKEVNISIQGENSKKFEFNLSKEKEIELIAKQYVIEISKDKYKSITKEITINALEDITLSIDELIQEDGIVSINSQPEGSIIRIDGQFKGKTPEIIKLRPNEKHSIELSLSGYKLFKTSIIVEAEEEKQINTTLSMKKGLVFISITPAKAKLYIDGRPVEKSSGQFTLTAKEHHLVVKAKGYKTQTKHIRANDHSQNISFNLKKINTITATNKANKKTVTKITANGPIKDYINSIKQQMRLVQAVEFTMGSKNNESGRGSNEREYRVKLDYAYYLSAKEISNEQFKHYLAAHNSGSVSGSSIKSLAIAKQPVVNISWDDAAKFANWLSKKEGLKPFYQEYKGKMSAIDRHKKITGYRLPYEAEWAYAARGKNQQKYPWSGGFPPPDMAGNFADESAQSFVSNIIDNYNDQSAVSSSIGQYKKNARGFYDLGGNVSEWCQDYYSPFVGSVNRQKITINPKGPKKGTHRVVRDSSWRDSSIKELRLSYRSYSKKKANDIGFRLARYAL
ncbi:SUMF1/EgtB/PvdO family nonheme iron enzyme [sulfur-oxidizing endosymbiont of Gigantopelta aegis]|uniref:SUMF1/EgtB/PvdO family nonheme iron enzyme n=1 Tax=sulfur-oxidizing endosymbiont of Gigantopelta aegis TaxID=2794934 RepID=UPI0018DCD09E|nr:SUMF1/EgtB/PvdO family nonheme iron enzyme [sulfur-oxidizing endosymbiont of Gigantopelta aegis]